MSNTFSVSSLQRLRLKDLIMTCEKKNKGRGEECEALDVLPCINWIFSVLDWKKAWLYPGKLLSGLGLAMCI